MNKIILIEGPDASGKSYLANQIMEKYPNHVYIHNAVTNDIKSLHKNTIEAAKIASEQHTVIIDRLHLSEKIYGDLFRNGPSYNVDALDAALDSIPNLVKIMCMVDKETSVGIHSSRNANGKEMFNDNDTVWDKYNEECKSLSASWRVYNWKTDIINLDTFEVSKK